MLSPEEVAKLKNCGSGDEVLHILREFIKDGRYEDISLSIEEHCRSCDCNKSGRKKYVCDGLIPIVSEYVINKDLKGYDVAKWETSFRKSGNSWQDVIRECFDKGSPDFSKGIHAIKESIRDFKK